MGSKRSDMNSKRKRKLLLALILFVGVPSAFILRILSILPSSPKADIAQCVNAKAAKKYGVSTTTYQEQACQAITWSYFPAEVGYIDYPYRNGRVPVRKTSDFTENPATAAILRPKSMGSFFEEKEGAVRSSLATLKFKQ